jgi:hypothetical protein
MGVLDVFISAAHALFRPKKKEIKSNFVSLLVFLASYSPVCPSAM